MIFRIFTIALFVFYLVADGPASDGWCARSCGPSRQRAVLDTWEIAIEKTGGYIYSRGLLAMLSGLFHWVGVRDHRHASTPSPWPCGSGSSRSSCRWWAPTWRPALPVLIALASSPLDAVWVLAFATLYQQVENYLFAPRITARTMSLHPAVAFGTVIAGAGLIGPIGAILALPAAAVHPGRRLDLHRTSPGGRHPHDGRARGPPGLVDRARLGWRRRRRRADS